MLHALSEWVRWSRLKHGCPGMHQAFVSMNWLLAEDNLDLETELAFGFLNYLLLGTPASPLYKVLRHGHPQLPAGGRRRGEGGGHGIDAACCVGRR